MLRFDSSWQWWVTCLLSYFVIFFETLGCMTHPWRLVMLCRQIIVAYCPRFSCGFTRMSVRKPVG